MFVPHVDAVVVWQLTVVERVAVVAAGVDASAVGAWCVGDGVMELLLLLWGSGGTTKLYVYPTQNYGISLFWRKKKNMNIQRMWKISPSLLYLEKTWSDHYIESLKTEILNKQRKFLAQRKCGHATCKITPLSLRQIYLRDWHISQDTKANMSTLCQKDHPSSSTLPYMGVRLGITNLSQGVGVEVDPSLAGQKIPSM